MVLLVSTGGIIGIAVLSLFVGLILGVVGTSVYFKEQLKKNPPKITEDDIRKLWSQTGRKLSETQLKRIMKEMHPKD